MTIDRVNVLVLMGGPDAERDVSIMSGKQVAQALRDSNKFNVLEHVIDKPSVDELRALGGDVVFPVLHGPWGEGGPLQELLEELDLPYVGSVPAAAKLAMDKLATKKILADKGIATPESQLLGADDDCEIDPPLVLKPVDDGSSVDLRICRTIEEIGKARTELQPKRSRLMAERYIAGRELTVGIALDKPLPIIEIVSATEFYDYDAKYVRDDTQYIFDPQLPEGVAEKCIDISMQAYHHIGCRDVARVDFMLSGGDEADIWFLEINTMPGFTTHSLVPMAAVHIGMKMPELCSDLVQAALARSAHATV
ncbi:MAG: D-alanine--D-alanine ligase [Planctomycetes bacterium]|nr:D-alanine--D-alanine ligase [Planctomycetota bacterium]